VVNYGENLKEERRNEGEKGKWEEDDEGPEHGTGTRDDQFSA
jgi:hypothetical protein